MLLEASFFNECWKLKQNRSTTPRNLTCWKGEIHPKIKGSFDDWKPRFYFGSTNTVGLFFPLSFNSYIPPLHFLYPRCSRVSSSFPWQQLPSTSREQCLFWAGSAFSPWGRCERQTEVSFSQRTSCQPKASGLLGVSTPCAGPRGDSSHCHFSLFPVWASQGLCECWWEVKTGSTQPWL